MRNYHGVPLLFVGYVFLGIDRENVVVNTLVSVFQFDRLGVLAAFEYDRTIHIVNFLVVHVFLPVPYMGAYIRIEQSIVFG
jgi:hypothetical protein